MAGEIPANIGDDQLVYRGETDDMFRMQLNIKLAFTRLDPIQAMEFYLAFNERGVAHDVAHLDNVRAMLAAAKQAQRCRA